MVFGEITGRLGAPVFMVVGLVLLSYSVRSAPETRSFVLRATRAEGTVTKLNAGGSHPQIRFTTAEDRDISYPQGGLIFGLRPGEKVEVLFDAVNPCGTATVNAVGAVWFTALMLGMLGTVFLVTGTIVWLC
jgi:hypothetical protein